MQPCTVSKTKQKTQFDDYIQKKRILDYKEEKF